MNLNIAAQTVRQFMKACFLECNIEKTLDMVTDNIQFVGLWQGDFVHGKDNLRKQLINGVERGWIPWSFRINMFQSSQSTERTAQVILKLTVYHKNESEQDYATEPRVSVTVAEYNGKYKICALHMSLGMEHIPEGFSNLKSEKVSAFTQNSSNAASEDIDFYHGVVSGGLLGFYLDENLTVYYVNLQLLNCLGYTYVEFLNVTSEGLLSQIHPKDRNRVKMCLHGKPNYQGEYEFKFRLHQKSKGYVWILYRGKRTEDSSGKETLIGACVDITNFVMLQETLEIQSRTLFQRNQELQTLTNNIPGGVFRFTDNGKQEFGFMSQGMLRLFGYTEEEFRTVFHNRFPNIIDSRDRKQVLNEIALQRETGNNSPIQYRVYTSHGQSKWVQSVGQIVTDFHGARWCYMILIDIDSEKRTKEEARISSERYHLVLDQSDSIIYEWNPETDVAEFSPVWKKKFGWELRCPHFIERMDIRGRIYSEDILQYKNALREVMQEQNKKEIVVRFFRRSGAYVWCKVRMSAILDGNGKTICVLGIMMDIDKEMRESQQLRSEVMKDALTGIYNRGALERSIASYLEGEGGQKQHAFFILDVDNFKGINDTFGHIFGDKVLLESARRICSFFRSDDIIGRIGGDEFVIFVKNIRSCELVSRKADTVCSALQKKINDDKRSITISTSIGIALFPQDGKTFLELYQHADMALYEAKRKGKNQFVYYSSLLPNKDEQSLPVKKENS